MIIVALGSNLPNEAGLPPLSQCLEAVSRLSAETELTLRAVSHWYRSVPIPASDQPDYVNGVALFDCALSPESTLALLHRVEAEAGRVRGAANAARTLDLDLLAYDELVRDDPDLRLPHPRLHERAFVLMPLCDVAPAWRHPTLGRTAIQLRDALPAQGIVAIGQDLPSRP